jgi:aspartate beta-hydroxylase
MNMISPEAALARAGEAHRSGRPKEAVRLLQRAMADPHPDPHVLNQFGLSCLALGCPGDALAAFTRAAAADPQALPLWLNVADAHRRLGQTAEEITALDRALAIDAYSLPALFAKAAALEQSGRPDDAVKVYRNLLAAYPDADKLPPEARPAHARAREAADRDAADRARQLHGALDPIYVAHEGEDLRRARAYADQLAGRRKIYAPQPVAGHFPFLPAWEYFDEALFPWLAELEAHTDRIRTELLALWHDTGEAPQPYVAYPAGAPVNQWAELNHSPRWGAYFLWRDGIRQDANMARCPETAALLDRLPLLDVPGKGPTAMFSILDPHTRIPPHTGSTNIRGTVHLPLIVPGQCAFRVGGQIREWREGQAWVFDDTIEHEAWNDSDRPRAILIFDCWNPFLTEMERQVVRAAGG